MKEFRNKSETLLLPWVSQFDFRQTINSLMKIKHKTGATRDQKTTFMAAKTCDIESSVEAVTSTFKEVKFVEERG